MKMIGNSMLNMRLMAIVFSLLLITTFYVSISTPKIDGIIVDPLTVFNTLGFKYLVLCISWILFMILSVKISQTFAVMSMLILVYLVYSMPRSLFVNQYYVDQLGFVLEAYFTAVYGHFHAVQGALESCAHAFFTATLSLVLNVDPITLCEWLPHIFVYLTVIILFTCIMSLIRSKNAMTRFSATYYSLLFLSMNFFTFHYSRQTFSYPLHAVSIFLLIILITKRQISTVLTFLLIFIGLLISHPASSLSIVLLCLSSYITLTLLRKIKISTVNFSITLRKCLLSLTISTIALWMTFQLSIYGSVISLIKQTYFAFKELFEAQVPEIAIALGGKYTQNGFIYYMLRHRWGQFIVLLSLILALITFVSRRISYLARMIASWVIVFILGIGFTIYAYRWMDRPYQYLALLTSLLFSIHALHFKRIMKIIALITLLIGLVMSPITVWGPAPFTFPPTSDIVMSEFLASYTSENSHVAHIGAHTLLKFHYELNFKHLMGKDLLWCFKFGEGFDIKKIIKYDVIAIFFRTYGKAGFHQFNPDIHYAIKELQVKLDKLGYIKVYEIIPGKEWIMVKQR